MFPADLQSVKGCLVILDCLDNLGLCEFCLSHNLTIKVDKFITTIKWPNFREAYTTTMLSKRAPSV